MMRRLRPAIGLFFLAPLVAEFLLGNLPITFLPAIVVLAPMYGGGALLIREIVRRRDLGWPNILILATAYGVLEEGLTTQSLFNPNYAGQHLLKDGFVPALGIAIPWTLFVVAIHVFWSISAPILMVETMAGRAPWLGRTGLIVTAVLFLIGIAATTATSMAEWPYTATPAQFAVTGVVVALLITAGLFVRLSFTARQGQAPNALIVLVATLLAGGIFESTTMLDLPTWPGVALMVAVIAVYLALVAYWSTGEGWSGRHLLAIGSGALLTYAWHSFVESPVGTAAVVVDLVGNAVFTAAALALIWFAWSSLQDDIR